MYNVEKVKKEVALKQAEANKKLWLIILSSGFIIIALVFIAGFYRLRQKNLQLKLSQSQLLQEQKIEKLKSISQKRILNAILDGKETERKEIAETLHDSVSALLSSANLHLQASRNQFNGSAPIEIEKPQKIISEASQKIRNLSHNLVSSILLKFGIEYAVKDLISKYSNTQIKFEAHIETISRYNQNFEIKIHNIIQELVNNILKHSEASMASISIDEHDNKLYILISDNGKGFSIKDIQEKDGLGLNQIEARIQMMSGKFSINSVFDKGTDIEIEIPILSEKLLTSDS
jgi:two-component system NarL family sensor kinase